MEQNPYEKGTMEYLDWATAQHDEAMKPKPKKKKAVKKKAPAAVQQKQDGLAAALAAEEERRRTMSGGIGGILSKFAEM